MKIKSQRSWSFAIFWLMLSVIYALLFISIEFKGSPFSGIYGFIQLAMQWFVVASASAALLGIICLNGYVFCIMFPLLIIASVIAAYYKITMGLSLTSGLIELAVVNNLETWSTVISPLLIILILICIAIAVCISVLRLRRVRKPRYPVIWLIAFMSGVLLPTCVITRFKAPVSARMPYTLWYSLRDYLGNRREISTDRNTFDGISANCGTDSITVVLIIGESLRSDHLSVNGYGRRTTPFLESDSSIISLPHMWSDEYFTHTSVPRIVTRADSTNSDLAYEEQSFLPLMKRAGFRSVWISNQDMTPSYVYFMHEADSLIQVNSAKTLYGFDKWLDGDILPEFDRFLSRKEPHKVAVLHTIGSHWWYKSHYPDNDPSLWKPEIDSRIVSELSDSQMINSYDNTIVYSDKFWSEVIARLRTQKAIVIYVSDHGESMGENDRWLHATDAPELHYPAAFVWCSTSFIDEYPAKYESLKKWKTKRVTTDMIFHSILDAADINTPVLNSKMSFLK